jgi:hypothetical protein
VHGGAESLHDAPAAQPAPASDAFTDASVSRMLASLGSGPAALFDFAAYPKFVGLVRVSDAVRPKNRGALWLARTVEELYDARFARDQAVLKVGGGANLFVHEDFAPASIYAAGQASFAGLRDYPILKSPNTAQVALQGFGSTTSARLTFSSSLVCEILVDDNYGAHIPGAYARQGALVRQGGSFAR